MKSAREKELSESRCNLWQMWNLLARTVKVCGSRDAATGTIYDALINPFFENSHPIPLVTVIGNHDIGGPQDKDALTPIDKYSWITVIRKPSVIEIPKSNLSICAIPWVNRIHLISRLLARGMSMDDASSKVKAAVDGLLEPLAEEVKRHRQGGRFVLALGHMEVTGCAMAGNATFSGLGSFEFAPRAIADLGAHAYALGHLHIRQPVPGLPNAHDGFLGTICLLGFGEENNAVGCRLLEIDGTKIVADRFLENKSSPRYYTVFDLAKANYRAGIDYVKLRGASRPETIPEGVIFEKVPALADSKPRTGEKLDCNMPLERLLAAWVKESGCKIELPVLVEEAEKFRRTCQVQDESIGSLESVGRIRLKNLTCHKDSDIDLNVSGICGISGQNGTGKSTAFESLLLTLYGEAPSRPSIQSMLPKGDPMESMAEMEFRSGGREYIARREFRRAGKTWAHRAFIFEKGSKEPLAGPKVEDAFSWSSRNIGDLDLVMAGVFSSQGDAGNLVKLKPAQRKDLFAKLLGTEKFLAISDAAGKAANADIANVQARKGQLDAIVAELATEDADKKSLERLKKDCESKEADAIKLQEDADLAASAVRELENAKKQRDAALEAVAKLEAKKQRILADGHALKNKKIALEALDASGTLKRLEEAKAAKDELDKVLEAISDATVAAARATGQVANLKAERSTQAAGISGKLAAARAKAEGSAEALLEAKRRAGLLGDFPDVKECKACPLAKDGIASRDGIAALEAEATKWAANLAKGEKAIKDHEAETVRLVSEAVKAVPVVPAELEGRRNALRSLADLVPGLELEMIEVRKSKEEAARIEASLDAARASFHDAEAEIKAIAVPAFDDAEMESRLDVLAESRGRLAGARSEISSLKYSAGMAQSKVDQHAERKRDSERISREIEADNDKAELHGALAKAFCRDGIPQIVVDSAIPHLHDIMFDLLSECDGKWSIRIATQKETKTGSIQERIDILVDDGEDERDVSTYSGGEMNLLSAVVRIAFSILQAERSGKGLKVLVLDEAMYFADSGNSESFVRMLQRLKKHFNQIFVVSHSEFVLASVENKIFFSRKADGSTQIHADFQRAAK